MRLYPGLYSGSLFHLLGFSAKKLNLTAILHYCLVSPAAQRHVYGSTGKVIILTVGIAVHAHSDAKGNSHLIANVDGFHIFQYGKSVFFNLFHILLFDGKEILILFHLFSNTVHTVDVLVNLTINQRSKQGASNLFHAFQRLVIIVQIN